MGGAASQQQDSSSNASTIPSTSTQKSPGPSKKLTLRQKLSFKRKTTSRDKTRPFRDLIKSWPVSDFDLLLAEFEADYRLLNLQKQCDLTRKSLKCSFSNDFHHKREDLANLELIFKGKSIKIDRNFVSQRCKNLKIPEDSGVFEISSDSFQNFTENEVETFLTDYLFTEKWQKSMSFQKLKSEFGCHRKLGEDMVQMWKNDLKSGDLVISVMESAGDRGNEKPSSSHFEIRCSSWVASSRSPIIRSLLRRKMAGNSRNEEKPARICFDEHIFPRAFAQVFVFFLYTDTIDWQLAHASEISVSSLSLAKAITSGRNPHVQLWKSLQIIQIARFFGVESMVRACEDIVVKNLSIDNAISVLQWTRENSEKYIGAHAFRLLEREFSRIATSNSIFDLESQEIQELSSSQFLQCTELELLEACVRWGEHALLRKLEEREPNIVADTCHSISRRGLKKSEMDLGELRKILSPLSGNIRKEYALPPFDKSLNDAYSRGILEREPLPNDLVSSETREINPDYHWLKPDPLSPGPRYYRPYHEVLRNLNNSKSPRKVKIPADGAESGPSSEPFVFSLEFHNFYPEILEESKFVMAQNEIRKIIEEFDIKSLPRRYHQNRAVEMITRRVLTELDISEECIGCHVATAKSTPPDVLPSLNTTVLPQPPHHP